MFYMKEKVTCSYYTSHNNELDQVKKQNQMAKTAGNINFHSEIKLILKCGSSYNYGSINTYPCIVNMQIYVAIHIKLFQYIIAILL